MARSGARLVTRHYCRRCGGRVFPFDQIDGQVESAVAGKRGGVILMHTYNATHPERRHARCFSCKRVVPAKRLTEREFLLLYANWHGIQVRETPKQKKRKKSHVPA